MQTAVLFTPPGGIFLRIASDFARSHTMPYATYQARNAAYAGGAGRLLASNPAALNEKRPQPSGAGATLNDGELAQLSLTRNH